MNTRFLYLAILILVFASCATSRKVQVIQNALTSKDSANQQSMIEVAKVDSGLIVKNLIDKIVNEKITFTTLNAKVKVDYETVDKSDALIANISIEKGKAIYIIVRGTMGVIGLKAIITQDSVFLSYPLTKKQEKKPLSYLQELLKIPFSYATIEDLLVGNPIFMDHVSIVNYKVNNNKLQIGLMGSLFKNLISLSEDNQKVLHLKLDDININQQRTCDITYYNHTPVQQNQFPLNRDIAIASQSRFEIHMEIKEFSFNEPLKYNFVMPKPGKRR
jgi:hypothetical protein